MRKFLVNAFIGITVAVASVSLGMLLIISMINTVTVDYLERCYFLSDNIFMHFVAICVFFGLTLFAYKKNLHCHINKYLSDDAMYHKTIKICFVFMILFSFVWNISTQFSGFADSASVKNIVESMHYKDFSQFENDGYLGEYHNQAGLILFEYIVSFVFGAQNNTAFLCFNCLFYSLLGLELFRILEMVGVSRCVQLSVWICEIVFLPTLLYTSFPYGTLGGLCFAVMALRYGLKYLKMENRVFKDLIFLFLFTFFSITIKQNFLIFSIALIILFVIVGVDRGKMKLSFASFVVVASIVCAVTIPIFVLRSISGCPLNQGRSSYNWIAMGLNYEIDDKIPDYAPGWWRYNYMESYIDAGYDSDEHERMSKLEISYEIEEYKNEPLRFLEFLVLKNASMWSDPIFESGFVLKNPQTIFPKWSRWISSPLGINFLVEILNPMQTLILLGVVGYLLFRKKTPESLLGIVFFCGGFLFHLFWEAKGQYTFPYYVILIPYGVIGLFEIVKVISCKKKTVTPPLYIVFLLMGMFLILLFIGFGKIDKLTNGDGEYRKFLADYKNDVYSPVDSGIYLFADYLNGSFISSTQNQFDIPKGVNVDNAGKYNISIYGDFARISDPHTGLFIKRYWYDGTQLVTLVKDGTGEDSLWRINKIEEDVYSILSVDELYAITMDDESLQVIVAPYTGSKNQQWALFRTDF